MVRGGKDIQTENGFVMIHPAILELLAKKQLSGREFRCLLFLFRKTYGYHKKQDSISLSQWAEGTDIPRTRVGAVLDSLVAAGIIKRTDNGMKRPATWGFNKYFEGWQGDESVTLEGDSLQPSVTLQGDSLNVESVTLEGDSLQPSVTLQGDTSVTLQGDNNIKKDSTTAINTNEVAAVYKCWEDNMPGMLSSILADDLAELTGIYGGDAVIRAIGEAVRYNVRNVKYVSKVLENRSAGKTYTGNGAVTVAPAMNGFNVSDIMGD